LFPKKDSEWDPKVLTSSASLKTGISEIWDQIENYKELTKQNGYFAAKRNQQATYWMHETIQEQLRRDFYDDPVIKAKIKELEKQIREDKLMSFMVSGQLLQVHSKQK